MQSESQRSSFLKKSLFSQEVKLFRLRISKRPSYNSMYDWLLSLRCICSDSLTLLFFKSVFCKEAQDEENCPDNERLNLKNVPLIEQKVLKYLLYQKLFLIFSVSFSRRREMAFGTQQFCTYLLWRIRVPVKTMENCRINHFSQNILLAWGSFREVNNPMETCFRNICIIECVVQLKLTEREKKIHTD